jgi:hypothetical protein
MNLAESLLQGGDAISLDFLEHVQALNSVLQFQP